jgi:N-acetylneuraminate epimerase
MNRFIVLLLFKLMLFSSSSLAQKRQAISLQWKIAGQLPGIHGQAAIGIAGPLVGIHNNVLILGGGANFPQDMPWKGGKKEYYDDIYVFEKNGDSIVAIDKKFHLPFALGYVANCSTSQGIICAGGENAVGLSNNVWLLQWNEKAKEIAIKNLPDLPFPVTNASISSIDNQVYLIGGELVEGVSNKFMHLDLNNLNIGWTQLHSLPKSISHAVMVVQADRNHNCIYVIGGRKKNENAASDLYQSVYQYDLVANQWKEKKHLPYTLSAGTGLAINSHYILLFGGDRGETFHKTEVLIAAINAEKNESKKAQLIQKKEALQISHPGFSKEVLLYNTVKNKWTKVDCIPYPVPATTTAVLWDNNIIIPCGEIKAGVRTPWILSATWSGL